jgi:hypothetical protein
MSMGHVKNGSQRSNFFILGAGASGHQKVTQVSDLPGLDIL